MNIFLPQSLQTQIELEEIADVKRQIISPTNSRTIVGIVQDGLLGSYTLTSPTTRIDWKNAMNIMSYTSLEDFSSLKRGKEYTGHELFSLIVPQAINISKGQFKLVNGKLESGRLSKDILGSKKQNAIHQLIWDEYGPEETKKFIDNTQRLINNFNLYRGFTVGYGDTIIAESIREQINNLFATKDQQVNHMITEIENNPDLMSKDVFEYKIFDVLNIIRDDVSKMIMSNLDPDNNFNVMISSGSKGTAENIGQIAGTVGLQAFEGGLIPQIYNSRTLAYFHRSDDRSESRGLVKKSFIQGLNFPSFIFHLQTGREGLIDQAIKSVTGDTPIIILENNKPKRVLIGEWIDNLLENNKKSVKHYKERDMELLDIKNNISIPTTDSKGNVSWCKISAITRHDPGKELYEIKTHGGRSVIVTESKSLLIWNKNTREFEHTSTPDVKVGDFVPVTETLPFKSTQKYLDELTNGIDNFNKIVETLINNNIYYSDDQHMKELLVFAMNILGNQTIICGDSIRITKHFESVNDVVLDKIVEINIVDVKKYPKVYDLTVPDTLNFGLANGLHVVDTATSGYAQRKLVKLLEDVKINYDGSVRTANDTLLQVSYGDSGADTTKQYEYTIKSIEMNNAELEAKHKFSSDELKSFKDYAKENENVYDMIKNMRDETRVNMIKARANFKTLTTSFMIPVNLKRIVDNRVNNKKLADGDKVKPSYVYEKLEDILANEYTTLMCMSEKTRKDKTSVKRKDENLLKGLFKFALYDAISPKRCVLEYSMSKNQFDTIVKDICSDYNDNMAQPGEMCGMLSAQAMGEPLTQMSSPFQTMVLIRDMFNKMYYGPIGEFVEKLMKKERYNVKDIPEHKNSTALDPIFDHYIYSVSPNETAKWMKIEQLTRHPVNGQLIKIKTKSGRSTTTTPSHSHLKRVDHKIVACVAKDLKIGDRVPIALKIKRMNARLTEKVKIGNEDIKLTRELGWFFGAYLADGSISKNTIFITKISKCFEENTTKIAEFFGITTRVREKKGQYGPGKDTYFTHAPLARFLEENFKTGSYNKVLPAFVFNAPEEFQAGLIAGYFDGDGNIDDKKFSIRVGSRSQRLIQDIALLLTYFGVFSSICEETSKNYPDKVFYTCQVQRKYCKLFKNSFKLCMPDKIEKLDSFIEKNGRDKKVTQNNIDMIPGLGQTIADIGKDLKLPGQSRNYGRYTKKEAIGRETLTRYIKLFKKECELCEDEEVKERTLRNIKILEDANNSDVVWDAIESIEYIDDPDTYVYDFTVPSTETFMVDCGVFVHNTLNAFHHTGIATMSSVTQGAPRITELMSVTKNLKTPQMIIRLKDEYKTSKEMAHKIASHIKYTTIGDIRGRINVYYDPKPNEKGGFMDQDNVREVFFNNKSTKNGCQADINTLPILMRIELNREKMLEKEVTILEIKSKFCSWWEKRFNEAKNMKKEERKVLNKIISLGVLSNTDSDKQPVIHIRFNVKDNEKDKFDMETINNFSDMIIDQFKLKGIDGIDSIAGTVPQRMIKFNKENGSVEAFDEQIILTSGVNIDDIRYIIGIDPLNTIINDVVKVYHTFGIEIARNRLYREFALAYEGAGHAVNYQNLSILVDLITSSGAIMSVDRHGMSKSDNDPLTRASFEKSVEQLLNAAFFGESDNMRGISSRIMAGMVIKGGTGYPNILLNTEMIEKSEYVDELATVDTSYNQILSTNIASDIMKHKDKEEEEVFIPI